MTEHKQATADHCIDHNSVLVNADLLPSKQTWNWYNIFAVWMSDIHSAGGYVFAGTLFSLGLAGWQVFVALILGILIVQVLANVMGKPSQKYAVPFPVITRVTFGVFGSNIPALIRGIIAVVWYGIQTYLASAALMVVVLYFYPQWTYLTQTQWMGLSTLGWYCFLFMWAVQTALLLCKMEVIRRFIDWAGPAVYVVMLILMGYIIYAAGWKNISFSLSDRTLTSGEIVWNIILGTVLIVSYFAGPTLNFGDFSRYAKSEKDMKRGNLWGLPVNFVFFSSIAVITISGTPAVFGQMLIDPIEVMGHLDNKWVVLFLCFTFLTATVGVNIVANFVSAAFDISNVFPKYITWRKGGVVAAILSVVILPWNLFNSPEVIHHTIDLLAGFIGPVYGIIIVDYYGIKKQQIHLCDLYQTCRKGRYWYYGGVNYKAVLALIFAGLFSVGGLILCKGTDMTNFSFFIGAGLGALSYYYLMRRATTVKTMHHTPRLKTLL